ncbi:MAG: SDR family NAD(P)-dependent oxidoreductase [Chloroflexaceae bacterium]|nr:SDR family NAD(P)-dependent oxidoreductase [Chloroflexaceae bacterium]
MNKHCVITGAADGIGRALALRFGAAGYGITGVDVDEARAAQTQAELQRAGAEARFIIADLGQQAGVEHAAGELAQLPLIDVLVHNAGISAVGRFGALDLARQQAVLHLNLGAPLLLSAALLRQERMGRGGSLVFLASLSCFTGYPGAASYAASKDGLAAYARSLAAARRDLHVLTVYPGPTRTAHARRYSPDNRRESRRMPPEQLANAIAHAVQRRQRLLIPGAGNQLFALLGHLAPRLTEWAMRKTVLEKV